MKVIVLDTETANTIINEDGSLDMTNVLVYDCGWAVVDLDSEELLVKRSFVNTDIFYLENDLMRTAYYAEKIPKYLEDIQEGRRDPINTYMIRKLLLADMAEYGVSTICAHNARFDVVALNSTNRWVTGSKYRFFLPFDVEVWDTMRMAQETICKDESYKMFCTVNGFTLANGKPRKTAEILYRFITQDLDFAEAHTGLEDVEIEAEILLYCTKNYKDFEKRLYPNAKKLPKATEFQLKFLHDLKTRANIKY